MIVVGIAYRYFVADRLLLPSHFLAFGFVLLRLLPLVNQLYALLGQSLFFAGGLGVVEEYLKLEEYPHDPFGEARFNDVQERIRLDKVSFKFLVVYWPCRK